jgi:chromosome segregation ATPase
VRTERENWSHHIRHLEEQLQNALRVTKAGQERDGREKEQLLSKLANSESRLEQAEEENAYLEAKIAALQAQQSDDMTQLIGLWKQRMTLVDETIEAQTREQHSQLQLQQGQGQALVRALQDQLEAMRQAREEHASQIDALKKDKMWLKAERDAVQEGYYRQQSCLQDQLAVINSLRHCLETAQEEHASMMKASLDSFNEIKQSFLEISHNG